MESSPLNQPEECQSLITTMLLSLDEGQMCLHCVKAKKKVARYTCSIQSAKYCMETDDLFFFCFNTVLLIKNFMASKLRSVVLSLRQVSRVIPFYIVNSRIILASMLPCWMILLALQQINQLVAFIWTGGETWFSSLNIQTISRLSTSLLCVSRVAYSSLTIFVTL